MKTFTAIVAAAALVSSVHGYAKYLDELPNGSLFEKALGHKGDAYTDFGTAFSKAGGKWSADFCKQTYPGTTMTNGAAFGDPCCKWTKGGKADKTVNAWTDKPTTATTCDAAAPATPPAAPATPPAAPATPATPAPPAGKPDAGKPSTPATPAPGKPDAGKPTLVPDTPTIAPAPGKKPSKCGVKGDGKGDKNGKVVKGDGKNSKKEEKSLDDDDAEEDYSHYDETLPEDDE